MVSMSRTRGAQVRGDDLHAELVGTPVQSLDIAALYEQAQQRRQAGHLILAGSPATVAAPARRGSPRGFLTRSVPHLGHDVGRYFIAWLLSFHVVPQRISAPQETRQAVSRGVAIRRVRTYSGRSEPVFEIFKRVGAHRNALRLKLDPEGREGAALVGIFDSTRGEGAVIRLSRSIVPSGGMPVHYG